MSEAAPIVEMRGISKRFAAVQALHMVDLVLRPGEVLGLVGDNAAGKSTLMKVLSGAYTPDSGMILIEQQAVHFHSPADSRRLGIEMVYQDSALANNLDVTANLFLGREQIRFALGPLKMMHKVRMDQLARQLIDRLQIDIPSVRALVADLSGGQRQAIAIGRATAFQARVIIMDEPTAAMSVAAIDKIIDLIAQLKRMGTAIILISHRLEDIYRVGDRVMVMRRGQKVADFPVNPDLQAFREQVVAAIIGTGPATRMQLHTQFTQERG